MFIDDKGIVLRCVKYDDKSFIAHVFTASHGHVSFMINASRGKRSGANARLFQPLSFLAFQWDAKPNATLHRMKEVRLLFVQQEIPVDPVKRYVAMMLAEFMAHALGGEAENRDLYIYIWSTPCSGLMPLRRGMPIFIWYCCSSWLVSWVLLPMWRNMFRIALLT